MEISIEVDRSTLRRIVLGTTVAGSRVVSSLALLYPLEFSCTILLSHSILAVSQLSVALKIETSKSELVPYSRNETRLALIQI